MPAYVRLLLVGLGLSVLLIGILLCRYLVSRKDPMGQENSVFLLWGVFGAIAGLCIASAGTGSYYLHLAPASCTILSGYSICGFLFPQFKLTRTIIFSPGDQLIEDCPEKESGVAEN